MQVKINSPQELEKYVIVASDPTTVKSEISVEAATVALDSIRNDIPVNTAAHQCIQLLDWSENVHAIFFAWSTLQLCLSPKITAVVTSRGVVDQHCRRKIREIILHGNKCSILSKQSYIRTKIGVVMALIVQIEYPEQWPAAFHDVIQALVVKNSADEDLRFLKMDLFLRILEGVCDEIVENQCTKIVHARNTLIKDMMRGFVLPDTSVQHNELDNTDTVVSEIIETLFNIAQYYTIASKQKQSNVHNNLAPFALSVLRRFIPWINLSYIANKSVISLLFSCFTERCEGDPEIDISTAIAMSSIDCLHELISRGMAIDQKVRLLIDINIFPNLIKLNSFDYGVCYSSTGLELNENTNIYLAIKVAQLINTTGLELIDCWGKKSLSGNCENNQIMIKQISQLLHQFMPIFFHCFTYDDIDVTGAVLPIANNIILMLGKELKQPDEAKYKDFSFSPHLTRFLTEIYSQMQYPNDFQFDQNSDEDAEEQIFRYDLRKLYIKVIRVCPKDISLHFLCQIFANIPIPLSSAPPMPLEAALRLLFHYSEGIRPNASAVMKMEPFHDLVLAIHSSDVSLHSLDEILMLYFDLAVRYLDVFKTKPEFLPKVLEAISGQRGLQHVSSQRVRSRSCYSLLRLVKGMSPNGRMKGYVDPAVRGIQGLLSNPELLLQRDDTLYLFETIGLLLGTPGNLVIEQQTQYLTAVIAPHIHSIQNNLSSTNLHRDPSHYAAILSHSIAAISYLSKGFGQNPNEEIQLILAETLNISLQVLQSLLFEEPVRNKTMILLQRMILCLNHDKVLVLLPQFLHILIGNCTTEDAINVSQLLNQICTKYKRDGATTIDGAFTPFIQKCQSLIRSLQEDITVGAQHGAEENGSKHVPHILSHIDIETLSIQKLIYSLIHQVVSNRITYVLVSPSNLPYLEDILQLLFVGAIELKDSNIMKSSINCFKDLMIEWGNDDILKNGDFKPDQFRVVQNGFIFFIFQRVLPGLLKCILNPSFKETDAMNARNVNEIALLIFKVKELQGFNDFETYFISQTLVDLNCPNAIIVNFREANEAQKVRKCLFDLKSTSKPT